MKIKEGSTDPFGQVFLCHAWCGNFYYLVKMQ